MEYNTTSLSENRCCNGQIVTSFTLKSRDRYRVIIEVKTVINVGDILRQLKLYSEYVKGSWLVLVSTIPVTSLEHQALIDEGVVVVVLGESF